MKNFKVENRKVGFGEDLFFIAEIGINHNGDLNLAKKIVDAAVDAGCDGAKFQTFKADSLYLPPEHSGNYHLMGKDIPIYDLHVKLEMPEDWIPQLRDYCKERDIVFFSTPVDQKAVDLLDKYGVEFFKVSSYDMTNVPLIEHLTKKQKPVVFSCGASKIQEVAHTADILKNSNTPFAMMHCVAKYPAPFNYANLGIIETLKNAFDVPTGFSSNGFADENGNIDSKLIPLSAAKLGADIFEIHITIDRKLEGPDHAFATEPDELKFMVSEMRKIREEYNSGKRFEVDPLVLGSSVRRPYDIEEYAREFLYKCLYAKKPIAKGERFTNENVAVLRPGEHAKRGLDPKYYSLVTKKASARRDLGQWQPINWEDIL